jgi:hypothetical protein
MPPEARTLALAERFHVLPWRLAEEPADEVLHWMAVMGVEGEVSAAREGMPSDELLYWDDSAEEDDADEALTG